MNPLTLPQIATLSGAALSRDSGAVVSHVCTDSRSLQPGDLFVALRGEKFDGHTFLPQIAETGAAAALIANDAQAPANLPALRVADTQAALQDLARNYRKQRSLRVVGVTGSNGKTSTKDFLAAVLGTRFSVLKTAGNFNNQIGLPLTILKAEDAHDIAVLEMGMSHPGDIAELVSIAQPDIGVITGIGITHLEFMKTREAIALEKGHLIEAISQDGMVALPRRDSFFEALKARASAQVVSVGFREGDVQADKVEIVSSGSKFQITHRGETVDAFIPVPGEHMVGNALLAIAVGLHFGIPLQQCAEGLKNTALTSGRLQIRQLGGIHIVDDSYNANPDSMIAALKTIAALSVNGRRIAALGRMGELGAEAENGYRKVGRAVRECGVDILITVGGETAPMAESARENGVPLVIAVADTAAAHDELRNMLRPRDLLLLKGSRSARMEEILRNLTPSKQII